MLFTPLTPGEYTISLEIVNMMETKVYEEKFYFNVITSNFTNTNLKAKTVTPTKQKEKNQPVQKFVQKPKTISRYTIQVASWTSLEKANADMEELIELGFDTYIEEFFDKKNDLMRWRVRIGSFENKKLAQKVKNKLTQFRGETPWIAYIK